MRGIYKSDSGHNRLISITMEGINHRLLLVGVILITGATSVKAQRIIWVEPADVYASIGSNVTITCKTPTKLGNVLWVKQSGGQEVELGGIGMAVDDDSRFVVTSSAEPRTRLVRLTIINVQLEDSQFDYLCKDASITSIIPRASLVVAEGGPMCESSRDRVVEHEQLMLTCHLVISGQLSPVATWNTSINGSVQSTSRNATHFIATYRVNVTREMAGAAVSFHLRAEDNAMWPFADPSSFSFPPLQVLYSPRNIVLVPVKAIYTTGEFVTCYAMGQPRPSVQWRDGETGRTCLGSSLLLTPEMEGKRSITCIATNVIDGLMHHARETFFIEVHHAGQPRTEVVHTWCTFTPDTTLPPASDVTTHVERRKEVDDNGIEPVVLTSTSEVSKKPSLTNILIGVGVVGFVIIIIAVVIGTSKRRSKKGVRASHFNDEFGGAGAEAGPIDTGVYLHGTFPGAEPNQYLYGRRMGDGTATGGYCAKENLEYMHIDDIDLIKQNIALERQSSLDSEVYLIPVN